MVDNRSITARMAASQQPFVSKLFRRRRYALAVFSGSLACLLLGISVMPRKYESTAKLLVKSGRPDLIIAPGTTPAIGGTGSEDQAEAGRASEIELLHSRDLLGDVVDKAHLVQVEGKQSTLVKREAAISALQSQLSVEAVRKSEVLQLSYRGKSPQLAHTVLTQLIVSYMDFHLRVHASPGSLAFFDAQATMYGNRLKSSEMALRKFREKHPSVVQSSTQIPLEERSAQAKALFDASSAEQAEYAQRVRADSIAVSTLKARVVSQVRLTPQSSLLAELNNTLISLLNRRTEAVAKFLPTDRFVTQLDQEIADTRKAIADASRDTSREEVSDINQVQTEAQKDLVQSRVHLAGVTARRQQLEQQLIAYQLQRTVDAGAAIDDEALARSVKEDEENYLLYSRKREEARISASLDQQRITDVAVIEAPTLPIHYVSPNVPIDVAGSFLLSSFLTYLALLLCGDEVPMEGSSQAKISQATSYAS